MKDKIKAYFISFRLRTLPLSLAGILLGVLLAVASGYSSLAIIVLLLTTTISLQILSNLCNELGDMHKGTDNDTRLGPIRSLQSGMLTERDLVRAIYLFIILSGIFGLILLTTALDSLLDQRGLVFVGLGIFSIAAAILYTISRYAFGYRGLGDLFVFIFFGWVSVIGSYCLMGGLVNAVIVLPATSIGLLSTGVLNINNIRDLRNDQESGKRTLAVRMGEKWAKWYHLVLINGAFITMTIFKIVTHNPLIAYGYLLILPLFIYHLYRMFKDNGKALDKQLRILCLLTLLFAVLSGINTSVY